AATCTARTVAGTEVLYQSFVWNIGVEMVSPVAWTLREVCTVQPLCRSIRFIGACATASASRNENRESTRLIRVISIDFAVDGSADGQANRHVQLQDAKGYRYRITGRALYGRRGSGQALAQEGQRSRPRAKPNAT